MGAFYVVVGCNFQQSSVEALTLELWSRGRGPCAGAVTVSFIMLSNTATGRQPPATTLHHVLRALFREVNNFYRAK